MNKQRLLFFTFLLFIGLSQSTAQVFNLTKKGGSVNYDVGTSVVADKAGNIYALGFFEGVCWFDSKYVQSIGGYDIYLVKYQQDGTVEWVTSFGGGIDDYPGGLTIDNAGNLYIAAKYQISVDIGDTVLKGAGDDEALIAKYDSSGNFIWARQFSGRGRDFGNDVKFQNGFVYFAGDFSDTVRFDSLNILISKGQRDIFLSKLDTAGNIIWVRTAGGQGDIFARAIATDALGNVYTIGSFQDSCSFYTNKLRSNGSWDIYIVKYDANGTEQWVKQIGGDYSDYGTGIAVTPSGEFYIIGSITGYVIVGNTAFNGISDGMLARFDNTAKFQWLKQGNVRINDIAVNNTGDAYFVGYYRDTAIYDNDTLVETQYYSDQGFIGRFTKNGNFRWITHTSNKGTCSPNSIFIDNDSPIYLTGQFSETTSFGKDSINSLGIWDVFITRLTDYEHTGFNSNENIENFEVYPNPTNQNISFKVSDYLECKPSIRIINSIGKLVYNETISKEETTIDLGHLATGIYILVLQTTKGTISRRIVKR